MFPTYRKYFRRIEFFFVASKSLWIRRKVFSARRKRFRCIGKHFERASKTSAGDLTADSTHTCVCLLAKMEVEPSAHAQSAYSEKAKSRKYEAKSRKYEVNGGIQISPFRFVISPFRFVISLFRLSPFRVFAFSLRDFALSPFRLFAFSPFRFVFSPFRFVISPFRFVFSPFRLTDEGRNRENTKWPPSYTIQ